MLTDEKRTRRGHVGDEASAKSAVNNTRYDAFFRLKRVRRCSTLPGNRLGQSLGSATRLPRVVLKRRMARCKVQGGWERELGPDHVRSKPPPSTAITTRADIVWMSRRARNRKVIASSSKSQAAPARRPHEAMGAPHTGPRCN